MPRRAHEFRGLTQPNRLRLLRAIQRTPGRGAQELAESCGIALNTVRDHLAVLEDEGLIRRETVRTHTRGRPPIVFHPVSDAAATAAANARVEGARGRGALLRAVTDGGDTARLGPEAALQLDVLYEHLDDVGLEPDPGEDPLQFDLAPCRFHELINAERSTVCALHARLVADVLRQVDGPVMLARLEPFVTPHRCRLLLKLTDEARKRAETAGDVGIALQQ